MMKGAVSDMDEFDVVVIGGGPGGYVAAARSSQLGLKTALVEKEQLGGTCVNWGCIPTKALLRNAEVVHLLSQGRAFGFQCKDISADYASAHSRSRQVARRQGKRVEVLLKNRNVALFTGEARLADETTVEVLSSGQKIPAKKIIVATGSKPSCIPGIIPDGEKIITSREALQMDRLPSSAVIVGAGPIGMEFATLWSRYGSDVIILERMPRVLPLEDADISVEAEAHFRKNGIRIKTGVKVESIVKTRTGVEVTVSKGEEKEMVAAEIALIATGFAPNTALLGLEQAGVAMTRGYVDIEAQMSTSTPNIYAIGDITGRLNLAHVASAQGVIAAEAAAGLRTNQLIYENIPRCVFGVIEVASVGLTESQALERKLDFITVRSPFVPNGKALALNENSGFIKLMADKKSRKLLGAHMIGSHVTEMVAGLAGMITLGATVEQLTQAVYPHPTMSEAVLEGLHALAGHAIHL